MTSTRTIIVALAIAAMATPTIARAQEASGPQPEPAAQTPTAAAPTAPVEPAAKKPEPFGFADFTWLTGNPRTKEAPLDSKVFTGEFRADTNFTYSFNQPMDDTIVGSSEVFRSGEVQVTQLGVGGDFHYDNVRGRLMTQFGLYSQTTPRNDASPARGQWNLDGAYRYISEAYGGYHWDKLNGINVDAGIFMSYVGLVQLLQLRQLDVPAVVRLVEHALVLQRRAHPDLPERQAEDRAVDHQRLAVVRQVQSRARPRRADPVAAERQRLDRWPTTTGARTRSATRTASASTPTTASR